MGSSGLFPGASHAFASAVFGPSPPDEPRLRDPVRQTDRCRVAFQGPGPCRTRERGVAIGARATEKEASGQPARPTALALPGANGGLREPSGADALPASASSA